MLNRTCARDAACGTASDSSCGCRVLGNNQWQRNTCTLRHLCAPPSLPIVAPRNKRAGALRWPGHGAAVWLRRTTPSGACAASRASSWFASANAGCVNRVPGGQVAAPGAESAQVWSARCWHASGSAPLRAQASEVIHLRGMVRHSAANARSYTSVAHRPSARWSTHAASGPARGCGERPPPAAQAERYAPLTAAGWPSAHDQMALCMRGGEVWSSSITLTGHFINSFTVSARTHVRARERACRCAFVRACALGSSVPASAEPSKNGPKAMLSPP